MPWDSLPPRPRWSSPRRSRGASTTGGRASAITWRTSARPSTHRAGGTWIETGPLFYRPLPGEDPRTAEVIIPSGPEDFVRIEGKPEEGQLVSRVKFGGLSFRHGQYVIPEAGHADGQAEVTIPAVITADGARDISPVDCEIAHVGIYAIWFRRGCKGCRVERCHLHDLGAGGVKIGEAWGVDLKDPAVQTDGIVVEDCIIRSGARIHHGAIGVWIGHSGDWMPLFGGGLSRQGGYGWTGTPPPRSQEKPDRSAQCLKRAPTASESCPHPRDLEMRAVNSRKPGSTIGHSPAWARGSWSVQILPCILPSETEPISFRQR